MRHLVRTAVPIGVVVALASLVPLDASGQGRERRAADLALTAVQEPPDFALPGQRFVFEVTTTNEGNRTAGASVTRLTLSAGRTPDSRDIRVGSAINVPRLAPGRSSTGRTTVVIPNGLTARSYFLIVCADVGNRVPESDNLHNCRLSGQKMDIGPPPNAPDGPRGLPDRPGARGWASTRRGGSRAPSSDSAGRASTTPCSPTPRTTTGCRTRGAHRRPTWSGSAR